MSVTYRLVPNRLGNGDHDYLTKTRSTLKVSYEQLIEDMIEYHSTVTRSDIMAVMEIFHDVVAKHLLDGVFVSTPLVNLRPSVKGRIAINGSTGEPLEIIAKVHAGSFLRRTMEQASLSKLPTGVLGSPAPMFYVDDTTGQFNQVLTSGGKGQLQGERMKFDTSDPAQGVFLVDTQSGSAEKVETAGLISGAVIALILPATLVAGTDYELEVRALNESNGELRTGKLPFELTAA